MRTYQNHHQNWLWCIWTVNPRTIDWRILRGAQSRRIGMTHTAKPWWERLWPTTPRSPRQPFVLKRVLCTPQQKKLHVKLVSTIRASANASRANTKPLVATTGQNSLNDNEHNIKYWPIPVAKEGIRQSQRIPSRHACRQVETIGGKVYNGWDYNFEDCAGKAK